MPGHPAEEAGELWPRASAGDGHTGPGHVSAPTVAPGWIEIGMLRASELAMWALVGITFVEIVARTFWSHSFGMSDEIGSYLMIALVFMSLPACQVGKVFHQVNLIQGRLSPRWRLVSALAIDVLCLFCIAVLTWQMGRLAGNSWRSGEVNINGLDIPLWIPQGVVVLGMAGLVWVLLGSSWRHASRALGAFRRAQTGVSP
jgi:TRAP-type C4-dicarboxylate transport system permease small subunit